MLGPPISPFIQALSPPAAACVSWGAAPAKDAHAILTVKAPAQSTAAAHAHRTLRLDRLGRAAAKQQRSSPRTSWHGGAVCLHCAGDAQLAERACREGGGQQGDGWRAAVDYSDCARPLLPPPPPTPLRMPEGRMRCLAANRRAASCCARSGGTPGAAGAGLRRMSHLNALSCSTYTPCVPTTQASAGTRVAPVSASAPPVVGPSSRTQNGAPGGWCGGCRCPF